MASMCPFSKVGRNSAASNFDSTRGSEATIGDNTTAGDGDGFSAITVSPECSRVDGDERMNNNSTAGTGDVSSAGTLSAKCFRPGSDAAVDDNSTAGVGDDASVSTLAPKCLRPDGDAAVVSNSTAGARNESTAATVTSKCPFGYDSQTFKLGPLSCVLCQALLFQCAKCVPCSHVYCKFCVSRFKDCPLCGADIERLEDDDDLQATVDRFIEGHARIRRPPTDPSTPASDVAKENVNYEDVSLDRGAFLLQQAMRAFRGQNVESAKSRLNICAQDIRSQIATLGNKAELCSQLGAVLGMLGDCSRATGDSLAAIKFFEESMEFLSKLRKDDDPEITHTMSVSLNKIGDLKYYEGNLESAKSHYLRSLKLRQNAMKDHNATSSQVIDVAISLAKVADVDMTIGNENAALNTYQEAVTLLKSLSIDSRETGLEQKRLSVLEFLNKQLKQKK